MDTIGKALGFLKDSVVFILTELKQLERMNKFISNNILTYELAINNLLDTIQNLNNPLYNHVISQSTLYSIISLINSHVNSLNKLVIRMNKWNDDIKKGGFKKFRALIRNRPSVLSEELFTKLLEIKPLLFEISNIERETLGSATRINNPLLKASWVLAGRNQVNDSSLDKSIIAENIYLLLKQELGGEIKKSLLWKTAINKLVNDIDGCAASIKDDKISISEMNEFAINRNIKTYKDLLIQYLEIDNSNKSSENSKDKTILSESHKEEPVLLLEYRENKKEEEKEEPVLLLKYHDDTKEEEQIQPENIQLEENRDRIEMIGTNDNISEISSDSRITIIDNVPQFKEEQVFIPLEFSKKSIRYNHPIEIPKSNGYGSNWPSTKLCEFVIPDTDNDNLEFEYLDIQFTATDQGWGDTGHDSIRYQINNGEVQNGFFIHRIKCPNNNYKLTLNWEKVSSYDRITLWLVCAPFGGWEAKVESIKAVAVFDTSK